MPRVTRGTKANARRKKIRKLAKGFHYDSKGKYRRTAERVKKALTYRYASRRLLKRDMRSLWIKRITAAAKSLGTSYNTFMHKLKLANCLLDRKMLSELAATDESGFSAVKDAVFK